MATYVLEQILSPQECAEIIELGTTKGIKKHDNVINSNAVEVDKSVRSTDIYFINDIETYKKIMPHVTRLNHWGYNFTRVEPLQLGIYNEGDHYDWHVDDDGQTYDASAGPFAGLHRQLSFSILLNEDFEGGEFVMENDVVIPLNTKGTMLLFPSTRPHKVNPVTQGTRYSLVGWCCGERIL
jgi:PKHD-type hydroxylase